MLSTQEVADRIEIQDLIARYGRAVDRSDWDALDEIFTPDASIDYTAMGGIQGGVGEIKEYLPEALSVFVRTQHMMGVPVIEIQGDRARAETSCHNPMVLRDGDDPQLMVCGLWYHESFVRTPDGWRIEDLREEYCYRKLFRGAKPSPERAADSSI